MQTISAAQLPALFRAVGTVFQEKKDELCALDARLGDGDLGLTMSKGFGALPELLEGLRGECGDDVGMLLMKGGMKMASLVPSTMGFLMSSGVMEGGKALRGAAALDAAGLAAFLTALPRACRSAASARPGSGRSMTRCSRRRSGKEGGAAGGRRSGVRHHRGAVRGGTGRGGDKGHDPRVRQGRRPRRPGPKHPRPGCPRRLLPPAGSQNLHLRLKSSNALFHPSPTQKDAPLGRLFVLRARAAEP